MTYTGTIERPNMIDAAQDSGPPADAPPKATFRTGTTTNTAVRTTIARAAVERGGRAVTADKAIAAAFALVGKHWPEYLALLDA
jgi:hypothetical protein